LAPLADSLAPTSASLYIATRSLASWTSPIMPSGWISIMPTPQVSGSRNRRASANSSGTADGVSKSEIQDSFEGTPSDGTATVRSFDVREVQSTGGMWRMIEPDVGGRALWQTFAGS
jgi:hypothetical protein